MDRRLLHAALGLSAISVALSVYGVLGRAPASPPPAATATACSCDEAALRREIADLRRALDARGPDASAQRLAARVAALEAKSGVAAPADDDDEAASATPRAIASAAPTYKSFDLPSKALSVRQEKDGALAVTNTDPSMTGKALTITARAEDGSTREVHIMVPAPEK